MRSEGIEGSESKDIEKGVRFGEPGEQLAGGQSMSQR